MSFPCSFSSSSLLTVPGAFFSAVARACAIVIFGLAVVVDANAPRATTLARVTAVVRFLIMCGQTRRRCMALHKFQVNAPLLRKHRAPRQARRATRTAFVPPNANELDITQR